MEWLRNALIVGLLGSFGMAQGFYRCHEYRPNDFVVDTPVSWQRVVVAIPKTFPEEEKYPAVLLFLDRSGRRMSMEQNIYCHRDKHQAGYVCRAESDMGSIRMGRDRALYFDPNEKIAVNIEVPNKEEQEDAVMDLKAGIRQAQAHAIACPPYVEQVFDPIREGEHGEAGPLTYVCYTGKRERNHSVYYSGCSMEPRNCAETGKKHFGYYPGNINVYDAYLRCVDGQPHQQKDPR